MRMLFGHAKQSSRIATLGMWVMTADRWVNVFATRNGDTPNPSAAMHHDAPGSPPQFACLAPVRQGYGSETVAQRTLSNSG